MTQIDYHTLKQIVNCASFETMEEISYQGVDFLLFPCTYSEKEREDRNSPAFYMPSTLANGDIYISVDVIGEEFKRPVLLHEILEAQQFGVLVKQGMSNQKAMNQAHQTAKIFDNKYAKENFDSLTYKKYCIFRKKWEDFCSQDK